MSLMNASRLFYVNYNNWVEAICAFLFADSLDAHWRPIFWQCKKNLNLRLLSKVTLELLKLLLTFHGWRRSGRRRESSFIGTKARCKFQLTCALRSPLSSKILVWVSQLRSTYLWPPIKYRKRNGDRIRSVNESYASLKTMVRFEL